MKLPHSEHDRRPEPSAWWLEVHDDIFLNAADTKREKRPPMHVPGPEEVIAEARKKGARVRALTLPALPEPRESPGVSPLPGGFRNAERRPLRVLLADDDAVMLHILAYQLGQQRWQVTSCADGAEVQRLLAAGEVDVLLVDLNLPHRNAYELLEGLAGTGIETRVIVMSEQAQEDKIVRAFELGADDFVPKPFNPRVVMSRIQRLLNRD